MEQCDDSDDPQVVEDVAAEHGADADVGVASSPGDECGRQFWCRCSEGHECGSDDERVQSQVGADSLGCDHDQSAGDDERDQSDRCSGDCSPPRWSFDPVVQAGSLAERLAAHGDEPDDEEEQEHGGLGPYETTVDECEECEHRCQRSKRQLTAKLSARRVKRPDDEDRAEHDRDIDHVAAECVAQCDLGLPGCG